MANKTVKKEKNPSKSKERGLFRSKDRRVKKDLKREKKLLDNKEEDEEKEIIFRVGKNTQMKKWSFSLNQGKL